MYACKQELWSAQFAVALGWYPPYVDGAGQSVGVLSLDVMDVSSILECLGALEWAVPCCSAGAWCTCIRRCGLWRRAAGEVFSFREFLVIRGKTPCCSVLVPVWLFVVRSVQVGCQCLVCFPAGKVMDIVLFVDRLDCGIRS
jgi:hypothetical protein